MIIQNNPDNEQSFIANTALSAEQAIVTFIIAKLTALNLSHYTCPIHILLIAINCTCSIYGHKQSN